MGYHNKESQLIYDERIEGLVAIRRVGDPRMSEATFYSRWRRYLEPVIMEYSQWWRRPDKIRYFSFRRLILGRMIERRRI